MVNWEANRRRRQQLQMPGWKSFARVYNQEQFREVKLSGHTPHCVWQEGIEKSGAVLAEISSVAIYYAVAEEAGDDHGSDL